MTGPPAGESRYLEAVDGTRLHYRAWPADRPRAVLAVLHGLFEHSRRYAEVASVMNGAGVAVFALDLRGHGLSEGRRGHVRRFDRFIDDAARFVDAVSDVLPGVPRFLLAHSMGGLVGIRYLEERRPGLDGAILTAPWLETAAHVPGWQKTLARVLDRVLPILPFPANVDPAELSHDPERVADYRGDPRIFSTLTPRLWEEVGRAAEAAFRDRDRLDLPLLFLLAGDDRIVRTDRSMELAESLAAGDVTVEVLDGYYHEVLQEVERAAVLAEILEWLEARLD